MRVTPGTLQDTSRPRLTASSGCFDRVIKSGEVGGGGGDDGGVCVSVVDG